MSLDNLRDVASTHPSKLHFVSTQKMQSFSESLSSIKSGSSQIADVIFVVIVGFFKVESVFYPGSVSRQTA